MNALPRCTGRGFILQAGHVPRENVFISGCFLGHFGPGRRLTPIISFVGRERVVRGWARAIKGGADGPVPAPRRGLWENQAETHSTSHRVLPTPWHLWRPRKSWAGCRAQAALRPTSPPQGPGAEGLGRGCASPGRPGEGESGSGRARGPGTLGKRPSTLQTPPTEDHVELPTLRQPAPRPAVLQSEALTPALRPPAWQLRGRRWASGESAAPPDRELVPNSKATASAPVRSHSR